MGRDISRRDAAVRRYAFLLRAYPRTFRAEACHELLEVFRDDYVAALRGPRGSVTRLWLRTVLDLVLSAVAVRWSSLRRSAPAQRRRPPKRGVGDMMHSILQDVRFAIRGFARRPGFTTIVVVTLALGVGANTAIFSVVYGTLLKPLPYDSPARLVRLWGVNDGVLQEGGTIAYLNFVDWYEQSSVFDRAAAYDEWNVSLTGVDQAERLQGARVNTEFFDVLGISPGLGRFFLPEEDIDGRDDVVVLNHGLWIRKFGGDSSVVGRAIALNGRLHTVVGVAPASFEDPLLSGPGSSLPEIWRPLGFGGLGLDDLPNRGSSSYTAIARLRPGVSRSQAQAELDLIAERLKQEYPMHNAGVTVAVLPLWDTMVGDVRQSLWLLLGAVAFVLAIAAANVGSILLGRAADRTRETALRAALGASRGRLMRQFLIEALALAFTGGALGVVLALAIRDVVAGLAASAVPRAATVDLNLAVFTFTVVATVLTGLFCGAAPVLQLRETSLSKSLQEGGRGAAGSSARAARVRGTLVTAEVALALLLLLGAGMLIRSFWNLQRVDVGIDPTNVLTFDLQLPSQSYPEETKIVTFYRDVVERLDALPGVRGTAAVNILPLSGGFDCNTVHATDKPTPPPGEGVCPEVRTITPQYFDVMGLTVLQGRSLLESDDAASTNVAVVNQTLAERLWPGEPVLGKRFSTGGGDSVQVVGVVGEEKHLSLTEQPTPRAYVAHAQGVIPWQTRRLTVVVRSPRDPTLLVAAVRREVAAMDPNLPLSRVRTMEDVIAESVAAPRFRTWLLGSFAMLALALAAVGIYGVISYSVAQRNREMAIRIALGAARPSILGLVLRQGMLPVAVGIGVGCVVALGVTRALASFLYGLTPTDPASFVVTPLILALVAVVACLLPAARATRVDPIVALRQE